MDHQTTLATLGSHINKIAELINLYFNGVTKKSGEISTTEQMIYHIHHIIELFKKIKANKDQGLFNKAQALLEENEPMLNKIVDIPVMGKDINRCQERIMSVKLLTIIYQAADLFKNLEIREVSSIKLSCN